MLDDLARIERHQQALARSLRVPDHSDLAVTILGGCRQRARHGMPHGVELVVASKDLDHIAAGVAEDDEVLHQIEEAASVEHSLEHRFQFRCALRRQIVAASRCATA